MRLAAEEPVAKGCLLPKCGFKGIFGQSHGRESVEGY